MKRMLLAIMAVAVAVSLSAPAFAGDDKDKKKDGDKKGGGHVVMADEKKDKGKDDKTKK